ncbi:MAG TPA: aminoglycoside phosphotransferase family protein [Rhodanobacteraceae bacterium]|nr:aminoglycoside phosphotransferase family protein [Rhodanobacteraceae bacterium]
MNLNADGVLDPASRAAISAAWGLSPHAAFEPLGGGLVNRTLRMRDDGRERVLQKLNTAVFRAPESVVRNCHAVTAHLGRERAAGRYAYAVLELVPTLSGAPALTLADSSWWRMYDYVPDARTHEVALDTAMAGTAARAFGAFVRALGSLPVASVGEVIPGFHDPARRYENFRRALADDRVGRATRCYDECRKASGFAEAVAAWRSLTAHGLPLRIVHNDCKIDNILFDADGRAVCVIDLDTVMPGSPLFDFGDLVRTLVSPVAEDSTELDRIEIGKDAFEAVARGYLDGCGALLTPVERTSLVFGARMVTGMLALRFLTDYLDGDRYFRVERPLHNLERARNQLALYAALGAAEGDLQYLLR